jgi:hypothetical protein
LGVAAETGDAALVLFSPFFPKWRMLDSGSSSSSYAAQTSHRTANSCVLERTEMHVPRDEFVCEGAIVVDSRGN